MLVHERKDDWVHLLTHELIYMNNYLGLRTTNTITITLLSFKTLERLIFSQFITFMAVSHIIHQSLYWCILKFHFIILFGSLGIHVLAYLFLGIVETLWMKAVTVGCSEVDGFHFPMISCSEVESISQNDLLLLSNKEVPYFGQFSLFSFQLCTFY